MRRRALRLSDRGCCNFYGGAAIFYRGCCNFLRGAAIFTEAAAHVRGSVVLEEL